MGKFSRKRMVHFKKLVYKEIREGVSIYAKMRIIDCMICQKYKITYDTVELINKYGI